MEIYNRENYILEETPLKNDLLRLFNSKSNLKILDIGGCEGEETIRYSRLFPKASFYIFEPLPINVRRINQNLLKYDIKNTTIIPVALSDEIGTCKLYKSSGVPENIEVGLDWDFGNKSSSLLLPQKNNNPHWLKFNEEILVETITLDSFFTNNQLDKIDFIHMDVQGAELKVLKGAKKIIKNIKAIWLEVSEVELYKNQPLKYDIEEFMKNNGFKLIKTKMDGQIGDQFYINKSYFKVVKFFNKTFYFRF